MAKDNGRPEFKDRHLLWVIFGLLAAVAVWNHIFPEKRPEKTGNIEFDRCMERLAYGDEKTSRAVCLQDMVGTLPEPDCHVEWDGRANPSVCE